MFLAVRLSTLDGLATEQVKLSSVRPIDRPLALMTRKVSERKTFMQACQFIEHEKDLRKLAAAFQVHRDAHEQMPG